MQDHEDPIDESWEKLKKVWKETSEETLGRRKQQNKAWMSHHTISKIALKRKKKENLNRALTRLQKVSAHAEYAEANKDVKRSVRNEKRKYIAYLAKEAETAASQHDMKTLYDTTKQMSSRFKASNHQIKDLNGRPLTTTEGQKKRWVEHFQQLLHRSLPTSSPTLLPSDQELDINCEPPTEIELKRQLNH